jgi:hypothetical protein
MFIKIEGCKFHLWTHCFNPDTLITRGAVSLARFDQTAKLSAQPLSCICIVTHFVCTHLVHASVVNTLTCYLAHVM